MDDRKLADLPADVTLSAPDLLAKGYRPYQRYQVALKGLDGEPIAQQRDVIKGGKVAAVIAVDLARDEIVLIRQFRLSAHLANGNGELLEIVAGRVEAGESPADAARRECTEEIRRAQRAGRTVQLSDLAGDHRRGGDCFSRRGRRNPSAAACRQSGRG
jgi:ADP-ribose pyrophosphatase